MLVDCAAPGRVACCLVGGSGAWSRPRRPDPRPAPAISTECWSFGPTGAIQLTKTAAATRIQAHEDNRLSGQCNTCWHCGEDVVFVASPYHTASCTESWQHQDGMTRWFTACEDSWWAELRDRLQLNGRPV